MSTLVEKASGSHFKQGANWPASVAPADRFRYYRVYGMSLRSQIELSLPQHALSHSREIEVLDQPASFFSCAVGGAVLERSSLSSIEYAHLEDGSTYARWDNLGEFLVSGDGERIACRRFDGASDESFQVYLLGQALSFSLVKQGMEPLHATSVVVDGGALVFLGGSGIGKSSLAASFLHAGYELLTDDLLLLQERPSGLIAYPGPARIKLFPPMAREFLGSVVTGIPMHAGTRKLVIRLPADKICSTPVPLRAIYALGPPHEGSGGGEVQIARLSSREAFLTLINNTFNYVIMDAGRLQRQFLETSFLVKATAVRTLSYPRELSCLPSVRDAILEDIAKSSDGEWKAAIWGD
jgi:hypothetical protein